VIYNYLWRVRARHLYILRSRKFMSTRKRCVITRPTFSRVKLTCKAQEGKKSAIYLWERDIWTRVNAATSCRSGTEDNDVIVKYSACWTNDPPKESKQRREFGEHRRTSYVTWREKEDRDFDVIALTLECPPSWERLIHGSKKADRYDKQ